MYDLFIGNHERVIGATVFHKKGNKYIPCIVTNYYFKSREYIIVPTDDLHLDGEKRRVIKTKKIYLPLYSNLYENPYHTQNTDINELRNWLKEVYAYYEEKAQ